MSKSDRLSKLLSRFKKKTLPKLPCRFLSFENYKFSENWITNSVTSLKYAQTHPLYVNFLLVWQQSMLLNGSAVVNACRLWCLLFYWHKMLGEKIVRMMIKANVSVATQYHTGISLYPKITPVTVPFQLNKCLHIAENVCLSS